AKQLGVEAKRGAEVGRMWLASRRSPGVLHLSCPGFFLPDRPITVRAAGVPSATNPAEPVVVGWENPLARSGLTLAPDQPLSARDLTTLDLWGTRAVMLPVVQTPVGQPHGWSRVSGLVNALVHAGARHVVLSLWRV